MSTMDIWIRIKAILSIFSLIATTCLLAISLLPPVVVIGWVFYKIRRVRCLSRHIVDCLCAFWGVYACAVVELFMGVKIVVTGSAMQHTDSSVLLVVNHRTRLDWLYLFSYQLRFGTLIRSVICLKDILKYIPGPGWMLQCKTSLFLERKWESDKDHISRSIDYYQASDYKPQIMFFPEGTDLTAQTKKRSDDYAMKNNLLKYEYVLHPKTTGFTFLMQNLKRGVDLKTVVDVTIGYPKNIPQTEIDLIKGNFPREVHFHIQKIPISDVPNAPDDLSEWCCSLWQQKEHRLKNFYQNHCQNKQFSPTACCEVMSPEIRKVFYVSILFWNIFTLAIFYLLFYLSWFRIYALLSSIMFFIIGRVWGGIDRLQLYLTESLKQS